MRHSRGRWRCTRAGINKRSDALALILSSTVMDAKAPKRRRKNKRSERSRLQRNNRSKIPSPFIQPLPLPPSYTPPLPSTPPPPSTPPHRLPPNQPPPLPSQPLGNSYRAPRAAALCRVSVGARKRLVWQAIKQLIRLGFYEKLYELPKESLYRQMSLRALDSKEMRYYQTPYIPQCSVFKPRRPLDRQRLDAVKKRLF